MLLIADSGSTKTEWMLVEENKLLKTIYTAGFNPYYYGVDEIKSILMHGLNPGLGAHRVSKVIYYGSGCSTEKNCTVVSQAIHEVLAPVEVTVYHDLLAAAHALLGRGPGMACILGTGSNSCLFDGSQIIENVPSLGYLLADEGSGFHIGKLFLTAYLYRQVPATIANDFDATYKLSTGQLLDSLYKHSKPGKYIAGFTQFVGKHIEHPFCKQLVATSFDAFIAVHLSKYTDYQKYKVSFTGSIAYHFKDVLIERMNHAGLTIDKIAASPAEGLIAYYTV